MAENTNDDAPGMHKYSCVLCHKRKVKCDRLEPCGYCYRHNDTCVYEAPPPPKRRKKEGKSDHADLLARLQRAEDQLRQVVTPSQFNQFSPKAETSSTGTCQSTAPTPSAQSEPERKPTPTTPQGRLIAKGSNTRYIDNSLWVTVDNELQNNQAILLEGRIGAGDADYVGSDDGEGDDADGMLLSTISISDKALGELLPTPAQQAVLWQVYIDNVHYLCMILHRPTFQKVIEQVRTNGIVSLPKPTIALLFSTFFIATASLSNAQCESKLRQSRRALLKKFRTGTRYALVKAAFTKSTDLVTIQAFIQFLLCMRNGMDSQTLWVLSGAAFRIAQRMGLHRQDIDDGLPPFEAEMRRRLWRQLMILDFTASELAGCAPSYTYAAMMDYDSREPLNVNEEDIWEGMKELPSERFGATDMIFCRLRYEFRAFFMLIHKPRTYKMGIGPQGNSWARLTEDGLTIAEKDKIIDELENKLQTNYLRFCDPINRLHNLTALAARAAVAGMRLRAHHPRQYSDEGKTAPQSERDLCFSLSMKILKYDILCHAQKELQGYIWHTRVYFQWHAFIFLLNELCTRTLGDESDRAWDLCEESFVYHPELIGGDFALYRAIRAVALRAWSAREEKLRHNGLYIRVPQFIVSCRERAGIKPIVNGMLNPQQNDPSSQGAMSAQNPAYPAYSTAGTMQPDMVLPDTSMPGSEAAIAAYNMGWPASTVPGDQNLFVMKPGGTSPIDWDAWDSLVQMDLPTLEFGLEAFFK